MSYNFTEIEAKWQKIWEQKKSFCAQMDKSKTKYYALDMFPYPSGYGLHVGHMVSYTPSDIISRYKRAKGFNVLHPIGYDAFGLPAEQFAIQTGIHPSKTTEQAIVSYRQTLKRFGFSFDWTREISTCEPNYYKWTQFIFAQLYQRGLAYQKEVPVNWCPALKTVLANDEVIDGRSERGGHPVIRVPMKQWMLKITAYAERLLNDLDKVNWPERTKEGQRNWIGKSAGARVDFKIHGHGDTLEVFTTRLDTLFGVTFMVMAPEHPWVLKITTPEQKLSVEEYIKKTAARSEVDRKGNTEKTGAFTGAFAIHPITDEKIPLWIADYVLMDYGTGAIMAVPGHDSRDFDFAKKFGLQIKRVLQSSQELPFEGEGVLVNSQFLDGLSKSEATTKITSYLVDKKLGAKEIQYKLRDWLFSRQRYWGEPFPLVHFPQAGTKVIPMEELPVLLPKVAEYEPSDKGESPLARNTEWVRYPGTEEIGVPGEIGRRDTDTMPGAAGSSWYFLRYTDPYNDKAPFSFEAQQYWMPVDLYVGGAEHTVGHLLYARFWHKVLFDCGLVTHDEPFKQLAHQGMVLGSDGEKMSKSRGNVVPADSILASHGADALRTFACFMGPLDKDKVWSESGIDGVKRFLDRIWRLAVNEGGQKIFNQDALSMEVEKLLHRTILKVTQDIEEMAFNTAVSAMMIFVNELYRHECRSVLALKPLAQLLMPFAPHIAEELWAQLGGENLVSLTPWPQADPMLAKNTMATMGVQVNGKMRGTIELSVEASESEALMEALKIPGVIKALSGKKPTKVIYKAGKILNLIVT